MKTIEIKTTDGVAAATVHGSGAAGVLLYPDAGGVRQSMKDAAERIAGFGYVVLLPNVYYRAGEFAPFELATVWGNPAERERLMKLMHSLTPDRIATDSAAYLDALAAQGAKKIGTTGYCMGGRISFMTAGFNGDRVQATMSFHGGMIVGADASSPHLLAPRIKSRVYLGVAGNDQSCSPEHQGALATALGAAGVAYTIELYQGKKHGFAVSDHAGSYDADAADRHWRRTESFFGETLR